MKANNLIIHDIEQGSDIWHQFRAEHFGASEASAVLGLSPYKSRSELLKEKATGIAKEIKSATQRVFDKGHEVEALARVIIENRLSSDLYPVTASRGKLSASCDGLTMDESIAWECKQYQAKLYESIQRGVLPDHHWPQCQQVLYVTGAEKLMFTCSDGTAETTVSMWVYPDPVQHDILMNGWAQFEKDLASYEHVEVIEAPKPETIMQLPAINVQFSGALQSSNLSDVTVAFDSFLANANTILVTDEDFANGEATAKFSRETAKKLKLTRQQIIDQVADISEATRIIDLYAGKFDALGLQLEKLVKSEKEAIKVKIRNVAIATYAEYKIRLEKEINPIRLIVAQPNFAEAMKNKRTLASLQDAVNTELANAKINADAVAKDIRQKHTWFKEQATDFMFLFNDILDVIYKAEDDFKLVVTSRIETHKKSEAEKIEKEREKIREEERQKALTEKEVAIIESANAGIDSIDAKTESIEKVTAQSVDDTIAKKRKADDDRKNPSVTREVVIITRDGIINAVARDYKISHQTAEEWLIRTFGKETQAA